MLVAAEAVYCLTCSQNSTSYLDKSNLLVVAKFLQWNEDELFVHISIAVYVLGRYKLYHLENLNIYEVYEEKMNNEK